MIRRSDELELCARSPDAGQCLLRRNDDCRLQCSGVTPEPAPEAVSPTGARRVPNGNGACVDAPPALTNDARGCEVRTTKPPRLTYPQGELGTSDRKLQTPRRCQRLRSAAPRTRA